MLLILLTRTVLVCTVLDAWLLATLSKLCAPCAYSGCASPRTYSLSRSRSLSIGATYKILTLSNVKHNMHTMKNDFVKQIDQNGSYKNKQMYLKYK